MPEFNLSDFMYPLDWVGLLLTVLIGLVMGVLMLHFLGRRLAIAHLYWQFCGGMAFFIPLAVLRGFQGSATWERLLATSVLWVFYICGMFIGGRVCSSWLHR